MKFKVIIQDRAFEDLERCYQFLAETRTEHDAVDWYEKTIGKIYRLDRNALKWGAIAESQLASLKLREMRFDWNHLPYRVFYSVNENVVRVLAIRSAYESSLEPEDLG
ncbi:MAG: type II toxin-antitoxin system RelE/ParE family toxin [Lacipirellulaceae bacterium]